MDGKGCNLRAWAVIRDPMEDSVAQTLLAIRYAQLEADRHGWKRLQIRTDVQAIVDNFHHQKEFAVHSSTIANDIILLSYLFEVFELAYIPWTRNFGCFRLAKLVAEETR